MLLTSKTRMQQQIRADTSIHNWTHCNDENELFPNHNSFLSPTLSACCAALQYRVRASKNHTNSSQLVHIQVWAECILSSDLLSVGVPPAESLGAYGLPAVFCACSALESAPDAAEEKKPLQHDNAQTQQTQTTVTCKSLAVALDLLLTACCMVASAP